MGLALLPNTEDLHAEKDAEDRLCQGPVGLRTHRSRGPHLCHCKLTMQTLKSYDSDSQSAE
jgi:hypothetical protein